MQERPWNVLLIEDDHEDYILTRETLSEAKGSRFQLTWVSTYEEGRQAINTCEYDVILLDYQLGPRSGLDLIREATAAGCKTPIILLTGQGNYDIDVEAMNIGATDYLVKSEVTSRLLERAIRYAILRKINEEALRSAKEELELRVQERTHELVEKNQQLTEAIQKRERMQAEVAELQRRLMNQAEEERRELARDLHDGPMQDLYGVMFSIDAMPVDENVAKDIKDRMLEVIHSLRSISRDLRPPALAPYGLQKAIQSHIDTLRQDHPTLLFNTKLMPDGQTLPEPVRMALYRIYQVAMTNVLRHSEASEVTVALNVKPDQVLLNIQDNGCGFDVPEKWIELARQGHLGLAGAAERAEAIGGKLEVDSTLGKGSQIRVTVPR